MMHAHIRGDEVNGTTVCRFRTLDALMRKKLVTVEHDTMSTYWITVTDAGRAVDGE
jgi:hypothetical protein